LWLYQSFPQYKKFEFNNVSGSHFSFFLNLLLQKKFPFQMHALFYFIEKMLTQRSHLVFFVEKMMNSYHFKNFIQSFNSVKSKASKQAQKRF